MNFDTLIIAEYTYLIIWSLIGSVLGYFAFSDISNTPPRERIKTFIIGITLGIFLSCSIFTFCIEHLQLSSKLSIVAGGIGALGLPDFLMSNYSRLIKSFAFRFVRNKADCASRKDYYE